MAKSNFYNKPLVVTAVQRERLGVLIKYLEQKLHNDETLVLKRREIMDIVGVSEGDSAKKIFRMLNEKPEEYSDRIIYSNESNTHVFKLSKENEKRQQTVEKEERRILSKSTLTGFVQGKNKFLGFITGSEIVRLWLEQEWTYNPLIQRGKKIVKVRGGEEKEVDVCSEKNIKEIAELLAKGQYITDPIKINGIGTEISLKNDKLKFIKKEGDELNILDGQHRTKALLLLDEKIKEGIITDVNLDDILFPLQVEQLTLEEAQNAFSQFTKGLKITTTRKEFFANNSLYTTFLKQTIASEKSFFNGRIEDVKDTIKGTHNFVAFGTLATALKGTVKEEELTNEFKDYFFKFFNILGEKVYSSKNEMVEDEFTMLRENITYYGYIMAVKTMYDNKVSLNNFNDVFEKIAKVTNDQSIWVGNVLKKGAKNYTIVNNRDTRKFVANLFRDAVA